MCGIVGIVGRVPTRGPDPLDAALDRLAARGPDGRGRASGRLGTHPVHLGARRLALVGGDDGDQPLRAGDGSLIVFNGEVYNHESLRRSLVAAGHRIRGRSDAEVLAALLAAEGPAGLARIEGSYAFAWLPKEGPLLLGRDPLGVRPLAVATVPGGLVFASTLDGLLGTGRLEAAPDLEAIADVLRDGVVATGRTALAGVSRVPPGAVLAVDDALRVRRVETAPVPPAAPDEEDAAPDVLAALRAGVADRLRSDRPVGVFLSGGVDSALVAALAREIAPVPAFTMIFPGHPPLDETHRARRTARRLGLEHHEVRCPRDPAHWVLRVAEAFDEPFADASAVPTWGLGLAAGRSVRAVLTGTGGDEVFGGYRRYWLLGPGPWLRHVPAFLRRPVCAVLERSVPTAARVLRAAGDPQGLYRGLLRLQPIEEVQALVGPLLADAASPGPRRGPGPRTAREAMESDLARYLPDDLLVKEDRALMAHGVEGRHPFLDRRVRRAAARLELRGSPARGRQKGVLRAYVKEVISPDLARAPKQGFAFPVDAMYRGALRPLAEDVLSSRSLRERGFVSAPAASRLLRDHLRGGRDLGAVLHAVVMLELWARRVLDGRRVVA